MNSYKIGGLILNLLLLVGGTCLVVSTFGWKGGVGIAMLVLFARSEQN